MFEENQTNSSPSELNPCLTCGACCSFFQASFYWAEADDVPGGTVPVELTRKFGAFRRVMIGTSQPQPRCRALEGTVGIAVSCSIYDMRSSVCRDFKLNWEGGIQNDKCDKARRSWGLQPVNPPGDTQPPDSGHFPKVA